MEGTAEQQVCCTVTYLRENASIWLANYTRKYGYPKTWTEMSKALKKRFGNPNRARKAQAKLMEIK